MGVQDVVARLNKSKSATTTTKNVPPFLPSIPKRKIQTTTTENKIFPPSPASSPTSTIHKDRNSNSGGIASRLQKFGQQQLQRPKSPPIIVAKQQQTTTVTPKLVDFDQFDLTATEMVDLFQSLLDQNKAAEKYIEKLQCDVEKYSSDATKVRDFEIRVEYLALKLEQVSEERDFYEKELGELRNNKQAQQAQQAQQARQTQAQAPMSPAYTYQHDIIIEDEQELQNQNNEAYMADILNVYEQISESDDDSQQQQQQQAGIQMAIVKYITDLEQQKLETKALKQVVKKQDELILKLEAHPKDHLLKEQVELQTIELENKRELLTQLLNEREDLLRRLHSNNNRFSRRSSIELILDNSSRRPSSITSISSTGRGTPPLTAPPKQPLPPLPLNI